MFSRKRSISHSINGILRDIQQKRLELPPSYSSATERKFKKGQDFRRNTVI